MRKIRKAVALLTATAFSVTLLIGLFPRSERFAVAVEGGSADHPFVIEETQLEPEAIRIDRSDIITEPVLQNERNVRDFTYEVSPILAPFPYMLYVKTDNPDPESFMLVDRSSVYFGPDAVGEIHSQPNDNGGYYYVETDPGTYYVSEALYPDAVYEDASIFRVNGGYIFVTYGAYSDGGNLVLRERISQGSDLLSHTYQDTDITVPCGEMKIYTDFLVEEYTTASMSFFQKLDAVQAALDDIAIYPRSVMDSSRPNDERPYPFLATSPYDELSLNEHYNAMFATHAGGCLLYKSYPLVLDSLGVPGTIWDIALMLDENAQVTYGSTHAFVNVTLNGETHTYGGAGRGGRDPLFTVDVEQNFTFDNTAADLGTHGSIEAYGAQFDLYEQVAAASIAAYRDLIAGQTFLDTIAATGGTWIRVATEGFGYGLTFSYIVPLGNTHEIASETWIDGRYINQNEQICLGVPIDQYPNANILLHDVTYTDIFGQEHTQDVIYRYNYSNDMWEGWYYYTGGFWYSTNMTLPDSLKLTREQVQAIKESWTEGARLPEHGLIYDGTEYPGTPFDNVLVTGINAPASMTLTVGQTIELPVNVLPENASYPQLNSVSSNEDVVYCGIGSHVRAVGVGTTTVTFTTRDGGFSASIEITVVPDFALNEALNIPGGTYEFIAEGENSFAAAEYGDRLVGRVEGYGSGYDKYVQTTIELNAGDCIAYETYIGAYGDYFYLYINGTAVATSSAYGSWRDNILAVNTSGTCTVKWSYIGRSETSYAMLDNIRVIPAGGHDPLPTPTPTPTPTSTPTPGNDGDVNGDGVVTTADAIYTLRLAMGLIDGSGINTEAADMDGNGNITIADAILVLRVALGLA